MYTISLILGGARSGKSAYAEHLAQQCPKDINSKQIYIATAEIHDPDMFSRIKAHQERRGQDWKTIEQPLEIADSINSLANKNTIILVDCLTIWLSNLMQETRDIIKETEHLIATIEKTDGQIIFVSNEVGLSIVPENKLARDFRDEQGILNQKLAKAADHVVLVTAGLPLILKQSPNKE